MFVRSDNGPEFIAGRIKAHLVAVESQTRHIDPGSPWQNAYSESFNGKLRDELLSQEVFGSPAEARVLAERWRRHSNEVGPQQPRLSFPYRLCGHPRTPSTGAGTLT